MSTPHTQTVDDVEPLKEQLAQQMFNNVPVGVGGHSLIPTAPEDLNEILEMGMDWSVREVPVAVCLWGGSWWRGEYMRVCVLVGGVCEYSECVL